MKVEINWTPGPPTKVGKCLLAIRGSEDAIPGVLGESGVIWSWTNPAVKYDPDTIAYHAAWPIFPRERDERWIECDRRTWEAFQGVTQEIHKEEVGGILSYVAEKHNSGKPVSRMEVNMYGHYGVRYFRWPTIREQEGQITPVLDGSEMIDGQAVDEYLSGLVKKASPSWQGVDPQQFMDEVRGCNAGLEWKKGAPKEDGIYVVVTKNDQGRSIVYYRLNHPVWEFDEIFFYIGPIPPIPPVPKRDEE